MYLAEYPIITNEDGLPFMIRGIGRTDSQPPVNREKGLLSYQILYVLSGKGVLCTNDRECILERGDACVLLANVPHRYTAITKEWATNWITFRGDGVFIENLLNVLGIPAGMPIHFHAIEILDEHFNAMMGIIHEKQPYYIYTCSGIIYETLLDICKQLKRDSASFTAVEDSYVNSAIEYMDVHYNEDVFLTQIAAHASCSPEYLCKIFRRKTGMRMFEYLAKKRIAQAKQLLTQTTLPIAQVGAMVGYRDNSYFGYVFKKQENVTPSEFRGL
ncbi:MAG: AraC family transcriptional regulator [Clostridia bacterium]|nr:AraC family transcriptional regulator [Clostridia bacterium]